MKKSLIYLLVLAFITAGFFTGCASDDAEETTAQKKDVPEWFLNPPVADEVIYGVGYAKLSKLDMSRNIALSRARADIARQVKVQVQSAMTDYFQEAGMGENKQATAFVENITRELTDQKIERAKPVEIYMDNENGIWALVSYSTKALVEDFEDTANNFVRSEEAAFSEFKAREASAMLDQQLQSNPTQSEPLQSDPVDF